jgi:hypothetical protein
MDVISAVKLGSSHPVDLGYYALKVAYELEASDHLSTPDIHPMVGLKFSST